jgi:hypothetical protein
MRTSLRAIACLACASSLPALAQNTASAQPKPAAQPKPTAALQANYGKLPLSFEANQGQADPQARFTARGQGYSLDLTDSAAVLALTKPEKPKPAAPPKPHAASGEQPTRVPQVREANLGSSTPKTDLIRMELAGANPNLRPAGADALPGKANYFLGNDPAKWRANVPTYAKVKYSAVYPGVDLLYYGNQSQLEYDFVLAPGADPNPVKLHFAGANKLKLNPNGDLEILARNGQIAFHKPVVYQTTKEGARQPIEGQFTLLANNSVAFKLGPYDHNRELVIDPVLAYSTYLGGSASLLGGTPVSIALDAAGNAYVAGTTASVDFPVTANAFQKEAAILFETGDEVGFVTKLNAAGSAVAYSTYIGAGYSFINFIKGVAVDGAGCAYLYGSTGATDFPVTPGAYQTVNKGANGNQGRNLFITKLASDGSALVYSTYFGGDFAGYQGASDAPGGIAVDAAGHAFIDGDTGDLDFPITKGAFDNVRHSIHSQGQGFVAKLNLEGSHLDYSTYLGTTGEYNMSIAVDSLGHAFVAGATDAEFFPVTSGAFQTTRKSPPLEGYYTGFVTELNPTGTGLVYSTYLGGSGADFPDAIALDSQGDAYVSGGTSSPDFPITDGAFETSVSSVYGTGFVAKLNPTGSGLVYSTYLGGSYQDSAEAIAIDGAGRAFVAGLTGSKDFPVTPDAYQSTFGGPDTQYDGFFAELNPAGSGLLYSTFLRGTDDSSFGQAYALDLDALGNAYLAGSAGSAFSATPGAFQPTNHDPNGYNNFVAKFAFHGATTTTLASGDNPQTTGESVSFAAHVAPVSAGAVPAGAVAFIVDGLPMQQVPLDADGDASYAASGLDVGLHTVVASYLGEPGKYSASSGVLTQAVVAPLGTELAAPTFVPLPGTYIAQAAITLETASPGAEIRYTTDNTTPTSSSPKYTAPIPVSANTTIRAIAVEPGYAQSSPSAGVYTFMPADYISAVSISASQYFVSAGQPVTFTAITSGAYGDALQPPTGSITFKHGSTIMGTVPLLGYATPFTAILPPGYYAVEAVYTGDAYYAEAYSYPIYLIVAP